MRHVQIAQQEVSAINQDHLIDLCQMLQEENFQEHQDHQVNLILNQKAEEIEILHMVIGLFERKNLMEVVLNDVE
jgi:hypothetical protein